MLSGLIGNERADQLAKEAAAEECDAKEVCLVSADTPAYALNVLTGPPSWPQWKAQA
jgi:hypothetical protein